MSTTDKKENAEKQKKTATSEYTVLKKFTGDKVYFPSSKIILDAESDQTKYLLTNKFIK